MKKLNISYKNIHNVIDSVYKNDDLYEILIWKLESLYNVSFNYYQDTKKSFLSFRKYIEDSLKEIDNLLNKCANITYKTFADKYEEISNNYENIDKEQDDLDKDINKIEHTSISENLERTITAEIASLVKKARFTFSYITETQGKIKKPKVKASVNNQIRPKNAIFTISSPFGTCGENIIKVEVEFNDVNYTTNLNFDTQSTFINVTTIANFGAYIYKIGKFKVEDAEETECNSFGGISLCLRKECDSKNPLTVEPLTQKPYPKLEKEETISIPG
jgi:hypothetical protein